MHLIKRKVCVYSLETWIKKCTITGEMKEDMLLEQLNLEISSYLSNCFQRVRSVSSVNEMHNFPTSVKSPFLTSDNFSALAQAGFVEMFCTSFFDNFNNFNLCVLHSVRYHVDIVLEDAFSAARQTGKRAKHALCCETGMQPKRKETDTGMHVHLSLQSEKPHCWKVVLHCLVCRSTISEKQKQGSLHQGTTTVVETLLCTSRRPRHVAKKSDARKWANHTICKEHLKSFGNLKRFNLSDCSSNTGLNFLGGTLRSASLWVCLRTRVRNF